MAEKKDFLSSLADEVENKKKGINSSDFDIYEKTTAEVDNMDDYKDIAEPVEETHVVKETVKAQPKPKKPVLEEVVPDPEVYGGDGYSDDNGPKSFEEEKLEKVEKKPIRIDPKILIGGIVLLIALGIGAYFLFFAPKIEMPDFVGKTTNEMGAWAKQQGIDTTKIILNEEFSVEYDKDTIITQNVSAGSKIKSDAKLTFTVSKGADPDEEVAFPDIKNMSYDEIKEWISTNKLSKTKINTTYSTTVPNNEVISYDLKNVSEDNFTRGATLTINISRGPEPAGQVTLENLVGKTYEEVVTWANTKKILLEKAEAYSETIESGKVISQSITAGNTMQQQETLTVVVSKGKGVTVPNLVGFTKEELEGWQANPLNTVTIVKKGVYNMAMEGTVVSQDITPGSKVDSGSVIMVDVSLYMPIMQTNSRTWYGKDFLELKAWCDEVNAKGANIQAIENYKVNTTAQYPQPGMIVDYYCEGTLGSAASTAEANACGRPLGLGARIVYVVTQGDPYYVSPEHVITKADITDLATINNYCTTNGMSCTYISGLVPTDDETIKIKINGGGEHTNGTTGASSEDFQLMLTEGTKIEVYYK